MCLQEVVKDSLSWINDESESGCPMFLMHIPAGKFRLSSVNTIDDENLKEVEKKSNRRFKLMSKWSDEVKHNVYYAFYPEELNYVKAFTTTFKQDIEQQSRSIVTRHQDTALGDQITCQRRQLFEQTSWMGDSELDLFISFMMRDGYHDNDVAVFPLRFSYDISQAAKYSREYLDQRRIEAQWLDDPEEFVDKLHGSEDLGKAWTKYSRVCLGITKYLYKHSDMFVGKKKNSKLVLLATHVAQIKNGPSTEIRCTKKLRPAKTRKTNTI